MAVAARLAAAGREVVVLERHGGFGRETSSRNSEVIHAGLYYEPGSLKARLCVQGNRLVYERCEAAGIACRRVGKLVIANTHEETEKLERLAALANANGVEGVRRLSRAEIRRMEPSIRADEALWSPTTGIFDTHAFMRQLEEATESHGGVVAYGCLVNGIEAVGGDAGGGYRVRLRDADGGQEEIESATVVNAAGLGADSVAAMAGIDIDSAGYRLYPCKGEYFRLADRYRSKLTHLVYPAPTAISLGIHTVLDLGGGVRLGPNAFYIDSRDDYTVEPTHGAEFYESAREYLPFVEPEDLTPDMAGIRAKLQAPGDGFTDFVIREESERGLPGFVNLVGLESPGLTSSLAIAAEVERQIEG